MTMSETVDPHEVAVADPSGDIFTAVPGLQQTHRLGNSSNGVAITLHIYGVAEDDISTGVNLLPPQPPLQ